MDSEQLARRRAERAQARHRTLVRRRLAAVGSLLLVVIVAVVVVASAAGSSPSVNGAAQGCIRSHARGRAPRVVAPGTTTAARGGSTAAVLGPATGKPGTATVPILMYHVIARRRAGAPFPRPVRASRTSSPRRCRRSRAAGWHPVTLDQLRAYWPHGRPAAAPASRSC